MFHALRNSSKILFRSLYCSEILGSGVSFCSRAKVLVSSLLSKRLDGFNRQPSNVLNFNRQPFFDCQLSERSLVFTLKRFRDLSEVIILAAHEHLWSWTNFRLVSQSPVFWLHRSRRALLFSNLVVNWHTDKFALKCGGVVYWQSCRRLSLYKTRAKVSIVAERIDGGRRTEKGEEKKKKKLEGVTLRFCSWWYLLRPYWNETFPCTDLSEASGVGRPFMIQSRDQPCKEPSPGFVWWTKVTQRKAVYYYWTRLASRAVSTCQWPVSQVESLVSLTKMWLTPVDLGLTWLGFHLFSKGYFSKMSIIWISLTIGDSRRLVYVRKTEHICFSLARVFLLVLICFKSFLRKSWVLVLSMIILTVKG